VFSALFVVYWVVGSELFASMTVSVLELQSGWPILSVYSLYIMCVFYMDMLSAMRVLLHMGGGLVCVYICSLLDINACPFVRYVRQAEYRILYVVRMDK
jgi:hypothetical protein